jgi:hypothetical protein
MARTMTWVYGGRGYTAGAAASRCYDDLVLQRGGAEADRVRDAFGVRDGTSSNVVSLESRGSRSLT